MNNKGLIITLAVILALGGIFFWKTGTSTGEEPMVCTQDVMQCPDGSFVSRMAPSCAFAPCPEIEEESPAPVFEDGTVSDTANMSIEGTVESELDQDMVE